MYEVDWLGENLPEGFEGAWFAAKKHLATCAGENNWLKPNPFFPMYEHMSFRLGNQIFMVYVEPYVNGECIYPCLGDRLWAFHLQSEDAGANACILKMERGPDGYRPMYDNWGLLELGSMSPIDPVERISDENIEMTEWELLDLAVQVTRQRLEDDGKKVVSWVTIISFDPSIYFEDEEGTHWVVVRAARYPAEAAELPENLDEIRESCKTISDSGYFASVVVASSDDPFTGEDIVPLYRGHALKPKYQLTKLN